MYDISVLSHEYDFSKLRKLHPFAVKFLAEYLNLLTALYNQFSSFPKEKSPV